VVFGSFDRLMDAFGQVDELDVGGDEFPALFQVSGFVRLGFLKAAELRAKVFLDGRGQALFQVVEMSALHGLVGRMDGRRDSCPGGFQSIVRCAFSLTVDADDSFEEPLVR
jgi:hypothetical protein